MSLPKITHPTSDVTIPSNKKKIRIRPLLVKEEKILLMAKESTDEADILTALKQVVNNCIITPNIDVNDFTIFDLEYIFIKIRCFSIGNITNVSYIDNEDEKPYSFAIDLNKIEVVFPEDVSNNVKITDNISITLKYPTAKLYDDKQLLKQDGQDVIEYLILSCLDKIYVGEEVDDFKNLTKEEILEFLENLPVKVYDEIKYFFNNIPYMKYEINYKNSLDHDRQIVLTNLTDFFSFR